jgi:hypothetical protein
LTTLLSLTLNFLDHLAVALISIGIIGLLFEVKEWRERFHTELTNIVNDVDQLIKLRDEEIKARQIRILQAVLKNKEINKEGGILDFYLTKIEKYIATPYREDTIGITKVGFSEDRHSFIVQETISYICRPVGQNFQDEVRWTTKEDEIKGINDFKIVVCVPDPIFHSPTFTKDYKIDRQEMTFTPADQPATLKLWPDGHGYTLSLADYNGINGLSVKTSVTYTVPVDRAFSWSMPSPSKGLTAEIIFPSNLKIYVDPFWIEPDGDEEPEAHNKIEFVQEEEPGHYTCAYSAWLLPGDGFAFHFQKIQS